LKFALNQMSFAERSKLNMKKIVSLIAAGAVLLVVGLNNGASAQIVQDDDGELHYKMCKAGQTLMKAEDMTSNGFWLRPVDEIAKTKFEPRPVNEILGLTDEEFDSFSNTEGNSIASYRKSDVVIIPVNEIIGLTDEEYTEFSRGESGTMPSRIIKPGEGYNPATWGYTPKGYTMREYTQQLLHK